jgi:hypothetical protein
MWAVTGCARTMMWTTFWNRDEHCNNGSIDTCRAAALNNTTESVLNSSTRTPQAEDRSLENVKRLHVITAASPGPLVASRTSVGPRAGQHSALPSSRVVWIHAELGNVSGRMRHFHEVVRHTLFLLRENQSTVYEDGCLVDCSTV